MTNQTISKETKEKILSDIKKTVSKDSLRSIFCLMSRKEDFQIITLGGFNSETIINIIHEALEMLEKLEVESVSSKGQLFTKSLRSLFDFIQDPESMINSIIEELKSVSHKAEHEKGSSTCLN